MFYVSKLAGSTDALTTHLEPRHYRSVWWSTRPHSCCRGPTGRWCAQCATLHSSKDWLLSVAPPPDRGWGEKYDSVKCSRDKMPCVLTDRPPTIIWQTGVCLLYCAALCVWENYKTIYNHSPSPNSAFLRLKGSYRDRISSGKCSEVCTVCNRYYFRQFYNFIFLLPSAC
jgi:hypothetical protein